MKWLSFILLVILFLNCNWKEDHELEVMTFNIRYGTANDGDNAWENRQSILIDCLKKYQPDILATQESLDFQIEEIMQNFPHWAVFGVGRYHQVELPDRPHESLSGESCKVLYDTTKFKLLDQRTFWHSDTPNIAGSMTWGNDLPRIVTWGIFQNKYTNEKFVLMNTHFHWDEPYVTNTTKLILRKWCEIANNLPTILLGDFNLSPNSFAHDAFCGKIDTLAVKGNFIDTWQALNKPETDAGTYNNFKGEKTRDRIDWILVTPEVKVNNIEIIHYNENGRYPSDHFPVLAQVELSSK